MHEHLMELGGSEPLGQVGRKKDARVEEPEDAGAGDVCRGAELDGAAVVMEQLGNLRSGRERVGPAPEAAEMQGAGDKLTSAQKGQRQPNGGDGQAPAGIEAHGMGCERLGCPRDCR